MLEKDSLICRQIQTFPRGFLKREKNAHLMLPAPRLESKFVARQRRVTMQQEAETTGGDCDGEDEVGCARL